MTVIVTPAEMRAAEARAVAAGRPEAELMRDAAAAIAAWIDARVNRTRARRVVALVGPGNNGGDALVSLANLIQRGWSCAAVLVHRAEFGQLPADDAALARIELVGTDATTDADIILDGIYGIGGRAELSNDARSAIQAARAARREQRTPLIALDVPSGVDSGSGAADPDAFPADWTLCLGLPKQGLLREPAASFVGELDVLDIGIPAPVIPDRAVLLDESMVLPLIPQRRASAHKSDSGSLLVVGGAPIYYGAPRLSGAAALRSGAGLVTLAVPEALVPVIAAQVPEFTLRPLPDDGAQAAAGVQQQLDERRYDAVLVGPGLGRDARADALLGALLGHVDSNGESKRGLLAEKPLVVDADALNWLAGQPGWWRMLAPRTAVLTPHPGEMARLLDCDVADVIADPLGTVSQAARLWQQIAVLKLGYSAIATPDGSISVAPRATPELATAGTGDVLAGLIGGFMAQGLAPYDAARVAVFVGGRAGRLARGAFGTLSVIATDVIDQVSAALRGFTDSAW